MQKCRCEFYVQAERFWWKAGISAPNVSKRKKNGTGSLMPVLCSTKEHWEVIQVCTHRSIQSLTQLLTQSICISLITDWIGSSTLVLYLNPALCLNYRAVFSLHSPWMPKYTTANVRLIQSSGLSQFSAPELTPGLTWYFKRWKLQNVSVRDLKAVSYFSLVALWLSPDSKVLYSYYSITE